METKQLQAFMEKMVRERSDEVEYDRDDGYKGSLRGEWFPIENGGVCHFMFKQVVEPDRKYFILHGYLPRRALYPYLHFMGFGAKYYPCDFTRIRHKDKADGCVSAILSGDRRGVLMTGPFGTGKTTILRYIAEQLITKSQGRIKPNHIHFTGAANVFTLFFDRNDRNREKIERLYNVPFLMLDNLGRAYEAEYSICMFEALVRHRYDNLLPTFFTANIDFEEDSNRPAGRGWNKIPLKNHPVWGQLIDLMKDRQWMYADFIVGGESMRGES